MPLPPALLLTVHPASFRADGQLLVPLAAPESASTAPREFAWQAVERSCREASPRLLARPEMIKGKSLMGSITISD
jgi:hypothetical protein